MASVNKNFKVKNGLEVSGGKTALAAATTTAASLTVPHGTAPTSPVDGDIWTTTSGVYARVNGTTIGPLGTGGGGGGGATVTLSASAPSSPTTGQVWIDTDSMQQYVYYDSTWSEVGPINQTTSVNWGGIGGTLSNQTDLQAALDAKANSSYAVPTGSVNAFAGSTAPTGWLLCAGQEIAIATYGGLYAVIGTTYGSLTNGSGGAGSSHFKVPDLRGRVPAGVDNMGGTDATRLDWANALGTAAGEQKITLTSAESGLPAHGHAVNINSGNESAGHYHNTKYTTAYIATDHGWGLYDVLQPYWTGGTAYNIDRSNSHTHNVNGNTADVTAANAASAHNNMQPTMLLNYIIKT